MKLLNCSNYIVAEYNTSLFSADFTSILNYFTVVLIIYMYQVLNIHAAQAVPVRGQCLQEKAASTIKILPGNQNMQIQEISRKCKVPPHFGFR